MIIQNWNANHYDVDVILIDGLWGTGKSLLHPIVSTFEGLEDARLEELFEYVSQLELLGKIDTESAEWLIKTYLDLIMHSNLLGRHSNLRWSDDTGLKHSSKKLEKIIRLFKPERNDLYQTAKKKNLGNVLMTHMIGCCPDLFFRAIKSRLFLIEIVRHPMHQVSHVVSYLSRFENPREKTLSFKINEKKVPWFELEEYYKLQNNFENLYDRAIEYLDYNYSKLWENLNLHKQNGSSVIEISFEELALDSELVISKLSKFLDRKTTSKTFRSLRRSKLPRENIHQGSGHKKYGWKQSSLNNRDFYLSCWDDIKKSSTLSYQNKLLNLVRNYDEKYPSKLNNYRP